MSENGGWSKEEHGNESVTIRQGGAQSVSAREVLIRQGGAMRVQADEVKVK